MNARIFAISTPMKSDAGRTHVSRKTSTTVCFATWANALFLMAALPRETFLCSAGKPHCPPLRSAMPAAWAASVSRRQEDLSATQERITFVPEAEEIAGVAVPHLEEAPKAVVSFGQGCEGEPLLQSEVIGEAIRAMRQASARGTINLNTNGSLPEAVENSVQPDWTAFASV